MTEPPLGMVTVVVSTSLDATLKQARLIEAGVDAKLFDPTQAGLASYGRATGAQTPTAQVFVAREDAARARRILATSDELSVDEADAPYSDPPSMAIGKRVFRLAAVALLFFFAAMYIMQVAGFFRS